MVTLPQVDRGCDTSISASQPEKKGGRRRESLLLSVEKKGRNGDAIPALEEEEEDILSRLKESQLALVDEYADKIEASGVDGLEAYAMALHAFLSGVQRCVSAPPSARASPHPTSSTSLKAQALVEVGLESPTFLDGATSLRELFNSEFEDTTSSEVVVNEAVDLLLVDRYALEMVSTAGISSDIAYGVALDSFLASPVSFRAHMLACYPSLAPPSGSPTEEEEDEDKLVLNLFGAKSKSRGGKPIAKKNVFSSSPMAAPTTTPYFGASLRRLFQLPHDHLDDIGAQDKIDVDLVERYAKEMQEYAGIEESMAFNISLDSFLTNHEDFRKNNQRLLTKLKKPTHSNKEEEVEVTQAYYGATLARLFQLPSGFASETDQDDVECVEFYAEQLCNEGVPQALAYGLALDAFTAEKNEFRRRVCAMMRPPPSISPSLPIVAVSATLRAPAEEPVAVEVVVPASVTKRGGRKSAAPVAPKTVSEAILVPAERVTSVFGEVPMSEISSSAEEVPIVSEVAAASAGKRSSRKSDTPVALKVAEAAIPVLLEVDVTLSTEVPSMEISAPDVIEESVAPEVVAPMATASRRRSGRISDASVVTLKEDDAVLVPVEEVTNVSTENSVAVMSSPSEEHTVIEVSIPVTVPSEEDKTVSTVLSVPKISLSVEEVSVAVVVPALASAFAGRRGNRKSSTPVAPKVAKATMSVPVEENVTVSTEVSSMEISAPFLAEEPAVVEVAAPVTATRRRSDRKSAASGATLKVDDAILVPSEVVTNVSTEVEVAVMNSSSEEVTVPASATAGDKEDHRSATSAASKVAQGAFPVPGEENMTVPTEVPASEISTSAADPVVPAAASSRRGGRKLVTPVALKVALPTIEKDVTAVAMLPTMLAEDPVAVEILAPVSFAGKRGGRKSATPMTAKTVDTGTAVYTEEDVSIVLPTTKIGAATEEPTTDKVVAPVATASTKRGARKAVDVAPMPEIVTAKRSRRNGMEDEVIQKSTITKAEEPLETKLVGSTRSKKASSVAVLTSASLPMMLKSNTPQDVTSEELVAVQAIEAAAVPATAKGSINVASVKRSRRNEKDICDVEAEKTVSSSRAKRACAVTAPTPSKRTAPTPLKVEPKSKKGKITKNTVILCDG